MTRILIADPDSRTRQALALLLERKLGVPAVDEAWDHVSLERQLTTSTPDALLLDCHLPGLSAAQIAVLASGSAGGALILMSVDPDDLAVAEAVGTAFIYKAVAPDEVIATLKERIPA